MFSQVGLVAVSLMCGLWDDLSGYNLGEEVTSGVSGDGFDQGDNGWKNIRADALLFPPGRSLLCAVLSMGAQFLTFGASEVMSFSRGRTK